MSQSDREKPLDKFSDRSLMAIMDGAAGEIGAARAANELLRRAKEDPLPVVDRIFSTHREPELRIAAINVLGQRESTKGQEFLIQNVAGKDIHERRAAIWSLAKTGGPEVLDRLDTVAKREGKGELAPTLDRARRLIAFRHGIDRYPFDPKTVGKPATLRKDKSQPMEVGTLSPETLVRHSARMRDEAPALDFRRTRAAVSLTCMKKTLWLVGTATVSKGRDLSHLLETPAVPMAIFAFAHCTNRAYLYGYVLSQPSGRGADLMVTGIKGQETHIGRMSLKSGAAEFSLRALSTRFAPAAKIAGQMDPQRGLEVSEALVSGNLAPVANLRRSPRLADPLTDAVGGR